MLLRSGREIPSGTLPAKLTSASKPTKIYDYIVRRNHIIKQVKTLLHQITLENDPEQILQKFYDFFTKIDGELDFLCLYMFEPNRRFLESIYDHSISLVEYLEIEQFDFDTDLVYRVLDRIGSCIHR